MTTPRKYYGVNHRLKDLRETRELSHQQIAEAIGRSASTYYQYETGRRNPSDIIKKRIAKFFDVSVEYIFFDKLDESGRWLK